MADWGVALFLNFATWRSAAEGINHGDTEDTENAQRERTRSMPTPSRGHGNRQTAAFNCQRTNASTASGSAGGLHTGQRRAPKTPGRAGGCQLRGCHASSVMKKMRRPPPDHRRTPALCVLARAGVSSVVSFSRRAATKSHRASSADERRAFPRRRIGRRESR